MWWQRDGAPAHTSHATMQYLRGQFPLRLMSKRRDWPWPSRTPDLAICDVFLWGYLKQHIWNVPLYQQLHSLEELRISIMTACCNLEQRTIHDSFDAMVSRQCIRARGHAFPNE